VNENRPIVPAAKHSPGSVDSGDVSIVHKSAGWTERIKLDISNLIYVFSIFSPSGSHTIPVFLHQILWQCSDGDPPVEAKITIFDQYFALGSMTSVVSSVVNSFDRQVYHSRWWRRNATHQWILLMTASLDVFLSLDEYASAEENRTAFNCMHWRSN